MASSTSESYDNTIIEFHITDEIKELGISRVYTGFRNNTGECILLIECAGKESDPIQCNYDKSSFKKTAKELESVLTEAGLNVKVARKFVVLFSKIWIEVERQQQKTQRDYILEEIRSRRKNSKFSSIEEWQIKLQKQYVELEKVVLTNVPEIWPGLEFGLSTLRILNIFGCNLPFIGLILGRPSSYKTQIINLLSKWYCTYYTDDFTAKSFVSHNTSVF